MIRFVAPAFAVATVALGLGLAAPASAAPLPVSGLATPSDAITPARMSRREMRHRRAMRHRAMRRSAPPNAGNARNPSRPPMQQNQGTTSGGPRY